MASPKSTPISHPHKEGFESAIRDGVTAELDRRKVGGGGGDDRIFQLERDVAVIKATMVTRETLETELGKLRLSIERVPLTLLKWLASTIAAIAALVAIGIGIMKALGSAAV
ncbi:MAG: hypothetical protein ABI858_07285 [Pseudoxanthomonas sp.]